MRKYFSSIIYYFSFQKGFTLVELLIIIAIIGVLAGSAIAIINPSAQFQKANDAKRKSDLSQMQKAIEQYYQDMGTYPISTADYKIKKSDSSDAVEWESTWAPYMANLPADPNVSKEYIYFSTGQAYYIYASLDRETNVLGHLPPDANCGSGMVAVACNYGVSSPNVSP